MSTPDALTRETQTLCRELVQICCPLEAPHFEVIWGAFFKTLGITSIAEFKAFPGHGDSVKPVRVLGAAGSGGMESIHVISALATVMSLLAQRTTSHPLTLQIVQETMSQYVDRTPIPRHLQATLMGRGVLLIWESHEKTQEEQTRLTAAAAQGLPTQLAANEAWVVWRAQPCQPLQQKPLPFPKATAQAQAVTYDLVIHEPDNLITLDGHVHPRLSQPLKPTPSMQRIMLWLLLTHVERFIEMEDIRETIVMVHGPRSPKAKPVKRDEGPYKYRPQLGELVGPERITYFLSDAKQGPYEVSNQFTFCWVRQCLEDDGSQLLYPHKGLRA